MPDRKTLGARTRRYFTPRQWRFWRCFLVVSATSMHVNILISHNWVGGFLKCAYRGLAWHRSSSRRPPDVRPVQSGALMPYVGRPRELHTRFSSETLMFGALEGRKCAFMVVTPRNRAINAAALPAAVVHVSALIRAHHSKNSAVLQARSGNPLGLPPEADPTGEEARPRREGQAAGCGRRRAAARGRRHAQ